ncbi:hypothetical protein H311_00886 [Anncaliia algerae PRA109]|nr:hypothetical protein H311_00886 [Anncaliia algerae PRA109]
MLPVVNMMNIHVLKNMKRKKLTAQIIPLQIYQVNQVQAILIHLLMRVVQNV